MGEEAVVKEVLTEEMISVGAKFTHLLDKTGLTVGASLWLYVPESNIWQLVIASPEVRTQGPKKVYKRIQSILSRIPEGQPSVELRYISVVAENHPWVSLLRVAIKTGDGISGVRFSRNTINGIFIEDAYIYRM